MPVPFQAALRDDLRPREPGSERALLEHRGRLALSDGRRQRQQPAGDSYGGSLSGAEWTIAPLRVACAVGLMLVALGALTVKASAMPGSWPQVTTTSSGEMPAGSNQMAAYGSQLGHLAVQPSEVSDHTSYAFNWTDASIGAAIGMLFVPFLAGGVLLLNRGRVSAQLPARSRPH